MLVLALVLVLLVGNIVKSCKRNQSEMLVLKF